MKMAHDPRIRRLSDATAPPGAKYILYWAQMNRRTKSNHALGFAVRLANEHGLPVLFYEGLACDYPYASDRMHVFILEGVPDTAHELRELGIGYVFYPRKRTGDANDILYRLTADAAAVVTDDYPGFIARDFNARVPGRLKIPYYAVDSSCVVPMARLEKQEYAAYTIRPKIRRLLPEYMKPLEAPVVRQKWSGAIPPFHTEVHANNIGELTASCAIDHSVKPSISYKGGSEAAGRCLKRFLEERLRRYARDRNEPSRHATSDLSPYLHFGQISALEVALEASRHAAENDLIAGEFLEELIVRRELAFNFARFAKRPDVLENLPDWTRQTLAQHDGDTRPELYSRDQLERAATHDTLWNAAQKELLLRGKIHGYYRMYWGKKIIEWTASHEEALNTMVYLNDRYALDGRDPNSYANILWCFGLHDRPWGRRPVFGTVRYMSLDGMKRKTDSTAYIREIANMEQTGADPFRLK